MDSANKKHSGINSLFFSHPSVAAKKKTQLVFSVIFTHPCDWSVKVQRETKKLEQVCMSQSLSVKQASRHTMYR
jgi:hypothetical protein